MSRISTTTRAAAPAERGFTMIEILVVLAIVAVLFGVGTGVFLGLTTASAEETARRAVLNLAHRARNAAVGSEQRSALVVEDGGSRVRAIVQKVVGLWHFEDLDERGATTGADRKDAKVSLGSLDPAGKVGQALRLFNGHVDCGSFPDYDATDGIGIDLWFRPETLSIMTLVQKGDAWRLWVEPQGLGLVVHAVVKVGRRAGGGTSEIHLEAPKVPLARGAWAHLAFSYDRSLALLFINQVEVARLPEEEAAAGGAPARRAEAGGGAESAPVEGPDTGAPPEDPLETRPIVPDPKAPLLIGSPDWPIDGFVDEVRVSGVLSGDSVQLPEGVKVQIGSRGLHFRNGWLDSEYHAGPVTLRFVRADGRGRQLTLGLNGLPLERD